MRWKQEAKAHPEAWLTKNNVRSTEKVALGKNAQKRRRKKGAKKVKRGGLTSIAIPVHPPPKRCSPRTGFGGAPSPLGMSAEPELCRLQSRNGHGPIHPAVSVLPEGSHPPWATGSRAAAAWQAAPVLVGFPAAPSVLSRQQAGSATQWSRWAAAAEAAAAEDEEEGVAGDP